MALTFTIPFSGSIQRSFNYIDKGEGRPVLSTNPSSSIVNDFIPYHALMSGRLFSANDTKVLLYNMDVTETTHTVKRNYEDFFKSLINSSDWYKLDKKNTILDYRCRAGQLVVVSKDNIVTPLMTLVVNKEHLFSINKQEPNLSKFFIVIDRKFSDSEEHHILYKNFSNHYLDVVRDYVNVIYTKNTIDLCYKQVPIVPIKPKTITESRVLYKEMTLNVIKALSLNEYT